METPMQIDDPISETLETTMLINDPISETMETPMQIDDPISETFETPMQINDPISETLDNQAPLVSKNKRTLDKMQCDKEIMDLLRSLSNNFNGIIPRDELKKYKRLDLGNNGKGDRFAMRLFNYSSIYANGNTHLYSDNENDSIDTNLLVEFFQKNTFERKGQSIVGIFLHSVKDKDRLTRNIRQDIKIKIISQSCVSCGSNSNIECDHKNDLNNDPRILNLKTQVESDFQPLCQHCNKQKRQAKKITRKERKIYSAKNILKFAILSFIFPWEMTKYDENDKDTLKDTYWYDPVEWMRKLALYMDYVRPVTRDIKRMVKNNTLHKVLRTRVTPPVAKFVWPEDNTL
jgi:ICEA Protein